MTLDFWISDVCKVDRACLMIFQMVSDFDASKIKQILDLEVTVQVMYPNTAHILIAGDQKDLWVNSCLCFHTSPQTVTVLCWQTSTVCTV